MNFKMSTLVTKPDFQGEFTASILAAAASPDIISFAGGLPNPVSFPIPEMEEATKKILAEKGAIALQYSSTPGYPALREWVAKRYETMGVYGVTADDIIITNERHYAAILSALADLDRVSSGLRDGLPGDLISQDLRSVLFHLAEITGGAITSDEVLHSVFKSFCIGK